MDGSAAEGEGGVGGCVNAMSFSEIEAIGCGVASGVGMGSTTTLGHTAPTLGRNTAGLALDTSGMTFNHTAQSLGQPPAPTPPAACYGSSSGLPAPAAGASGSPDLGKPTPAPSLVPSPPPIPPLSLSTSGSSILAGIQVSSPLTSPTVSYVPVSRPNIVTMRGIGGFTSPTLSPPPPIVTSNSIASTLGNPQMPSVTYFNSPSPMGFNFRMAGSHLSGLSIVYKRKPEEEPEEVRKPVTKQHISEERMAAHLNSLHLSERYCNHRLGKRGWSEKEVEADMDEDQGLGEDEQPGGSSPEDAKGSPRLYIANEVNQIIPGESQLPPQLLKKLAQPKMEVVLWQPPGNVIRNIITTTISQQQQQQSEKPSTNPAATVAVPSSEPSTSSAAPRDASNSSSPDSGVSVTSPPPSLGFPSQDSAGAASSSSFTSSASSDMDDLLSLPSTSSGSRGGYMPPLRRPASPLPDPMVDDDFSERMEFNNNNDNAPNYMWLEENNNSALIDLNAIEPHRAPHLDDLPDLPDSDDMDL